MHSLFKSLDSFNSVKFLLGSSRKMAKDSVLPADTHSPTAVHVEKKEYKQTNIQVGSDSHSSQHREKWQCRGVGSAREECETGISFIQGSIMKFSRLSNVLLIFLLPNTHHVMKLCSYYNLQIRLPSGDVIRHSFAATDKLKAVQKWLKTDNPELDSFTLLQPFPHKVMSKTDMKFSLAAHGLVPSGTLMLTNLQKNPNQKKFSCFSPLIRWFSRRT